MRAVATGGLIPPMPAGVDMTPPKEVKQNKELQRRWAPEVAKPYFEARFRDSSLNTVSFKQTSQCTSPPQVTLNHANMSLVSCEA